jgi:hypothetical protein
MIKRGQAWGFDLMVASTIFIAGIIIFYLYTINYPTQGKEILEELFYEGNLATDNLLSKGIPENWDQTNIIIIGITDSGKINQTKLDRLYDLSQTDYQKTKGLLNTKYDYFFNFSKQMTANGTQINGIGTQIPQNPRNRLKVARFTIYNNEPVSLDLHIWEGNG